MRSPSFPLRCVPGSRRCTHAAISFLAVSSKTSPRCSVPLLPPGESSESRHVVMLSRIANHLVASFIHTISTRSRCVHTIRLSPPFSASARPLATQTSAPFPRAHVPASTHRPVSPSPTYSVSRAACRLTSRPRSPRGFPTPSRWSCSSSSSSPSPGAHGELPTRALWTASDAARLFITLSRATQRRALSRFTFRGERIDSYCNPRPSSPRGIPGTSCARPGGLWSLSRRAR